MDDKIIIAHRGASAYEKDNTLESFKKAIEMGANYIEFDLRKTKDDIFIAYHDPKINGRLIKNTSYNDLKKLGETKNLKIPKVKDIIKACGKKICFDIHLKESQSGIEAAQLIKKLVNEKRIIITSEHMDALIQIRKKHPKLKLGYIMLRENLLIFIKNFINLRFFPKNIIEDLCSKKIDFLFPHYRFVGNQTLKEAKKAGINILPWTINNKRTIKKFLKKDGIYGIATDRPDLVNLIIN